jgi:transcriptional antiterminator RfaH
MKTDAAKPQALTRPPWFLVQLRPNSEAVAKRNLVRQGVKIFAPFEEVTVRKGRKLVQTHKAVFPGYMFVSVGSDFFRWRAVNSTVGVSRLVSFAEGQPAQVPFELISRLMRRCDSAGKLLPSLQFHCGDTVRVAHGPFADFIATVEHVAQGERIWVLLDILGKSTRVAIRSTDLRIAGS